MDMANKNGADIFDRPAHSLDCRHRSAEECAREQGADGLSVLLFNMKLSDALSGYPAFSQHYV
jgi:hypothetical protein